MSTAEKDLFTGERKTLMAGVLTESSKVVCAHGGAVSTSGSARILIDGGKVLKKGGVVGKSVSAACSTVPASDSSGPTAVKCTTVASLSAGDATKLFIDGEPVLLDSPLVGTTDGMVAKTTPQALGTAAAQQPKLTAI
jgi:hypothetical protein